MGGEGGITQIATHTMHRRHRRCRSKSTLEAISRPKNQPICPCTWPSGAWLMLPGTTATKPPTRQGCIRREGTSEVAPDAVGQAVGGGCQSGWGRLLSVNNGIEPGTCRQGDTSTCIPHRSNDLPWSNGPF